MKRVFLFMLGACVLSFSPAQTYTNDSLIIREILDLNGLSDLRVEHVTDSGGGRITALYLVGLDLDTLVFPSHVGNLDALTLLDLSTNNLTALPAPIGDLLSLEELLVLYNSLTALAPEIGNPLCAHRRKPACLRRQCSDGEGRRLCCLTGVVPD